MRHSTFILFGIAALLVISGLRLSNGQADAQEGEKSHDRGAATAPARLTECLRAGSRVDVSFTDGSCILVVFGDKEFKKQLDLAKRIIAKHQELEEAPRDGDREIALNKLREEAQRVRSMWEVAYFGENYIRLERLLNLPFREDTAWLVIPESTIFYIKGYE